jgi:hypothetical protein
MTAATKRYENHVKGKSGLGPVFFNLAWPLGGVGPA